MDSDAAAVTDYSNLQIVTETTTVRSRRLPGAGHASVLNNAQNTRIRDSTFIINTTTVNTPSGPTLDALYHRVAPNAISNEGGRADDANCLPGTREEVIGLIEKWMGGIEGDRILWLSGPAGGGKTAIVKAISDRSIERGAHTINFFFFRGDSTRNSAKSFFSTLLYQLFQLYPSASDSIAKVISTHPRVFDASIAEQCNLLSALSFIIRQTLLPDASVVLLVDGLDECDVDADRAQRDILRALDALVIEKASPFRVLVASRPEARIKQVFNQLSSYAQTIFLDEQFSPAKDIRIFVIAEFQKIKESHPTAHLLAHDWPSEADIENIVDKSSGQFIYAATLMRCIAHASIVPSLSLEQVKGIIPSAKNFPFAKIDSIYLHVLFHVDNPNITLEILSMMILRNRLSTEQPLIDLLCHYDSRYNHPFLESCASELSALVQLVDNGDLKFYHASFVEFLRNPSRSGAYWIDLGAFHAKFLLKLWNKPEITQDHRGGQLFPFIPRIHNLQMLLLDRLDNASPDITYTLVALPLPSWTIGARTYLDLDITGPRFLHAIARLYCTNDYFQKFLPILRKYIWAHLSGPMHSNMRVVRYNPRHFFVDHCWNWCMRLLFSFLVFVVFLVYIVIGIWML